MKGLKIAVVAAHGFEEVELTYPLKYFKARGAQVEIVTPDWIKDRVMAVKFLKPSIWLPVTKQVSQAKPTDYCAVVVPGGAWNPIIMRTDGKILDFIRGANENGKLIASVCHGPQVLLSAGLVKGKDITGVGDIRTDLRNAGANVIEDRPVVVDENILTSRDPNDLKEFSQGIEEYLKKNLKFCKSREKAGASAAPAEPSSTEQQVTCPGCNGAKTLRGGPGMYPYTCPTCKGKGTVPGIPRPPVSTDH
ncbi:MAG: DJ-1/PfpI family protein [Candidatus Riflebacteria bacterium]|nr:DJ-1/PfpI family protein [Candidatus Riflebacteria bacterium]